MTSVVGGIGHVPLPHLFRSMDVMAIQPDSYFISFIGAVERSIRPDVVEAFNMSLAEHEESPVEGASRANAQMQAARRQSRVAF